MKLKVALRLVMHYDIISVFCLHKYSAAESNVKKVSLELGGKSPLIIFNDCDLDKAVRLVRPVFPNLFIQ